MATDPKNTKRTEEHVDSELSDEQLESASGGIPVPASTEDGLKADRVGGPPR